MILEENDAVVSKFVVGALETNCYVVHEKRSRKGILIDPGAHDPEVEKYITDSGIDIEYILNTHGHVDHMLGNEAFGFPVLIHELDEPYLRDAGKNLQDMVYADVRPTRASRMLKGGDTIALGSLKLEVIHTPGHTPGSVSIRLGNLLFSGDALFFESVGRTDIPGGDHEALIKAINEKLMALPGSVRVLPGHGPETTIEHEREHNPFLN
jgi:hydroxyacylglutathione hydrolase